MRKRKVKTIDAPSTKKSTFEGHLYGEVCLSTSFILLCCLSCVALLFFVINVTIVFML